MSSENTTPVGDKLWIEPGDPATEYESVIRESGVLSAPGLRSLAVKASSRQPPLCDLMRFTVMMDNGRYQVFRATTEFVRDGKAFKNVMLGKIAKMAAIETHRGTMGGRIS